MSAAWNKANPEKMREACARWRRTNPEKARAGSAAWRRENPEYAKARRQGHRASTLLLMGRACTGCGAVGVTSAPDAGKYNTERYGMFVQAGYKY